MQAPVAHCNVNALWQSILHQSESRLIPVLETPYWLITSIALFCSRCMRTCFICNALAACLQKSTYT